MMSTCERCGRPVTPTHYEPAPHRFPEQCVDALVSYVKDLEWKLGTTSLELQTAKMRLGVRGAVG